MKKNKNVKKPFFSKFLEPQSVKDTETLKGGGPGAVTLKYPSDNDEGNVTLKFPSDNDEGAVTLKFPSDNDEGSVTLKYPSDGDEI